MVPLLDWFNDQTRTVICCRDADISLYKMMNWNVENAKFYNNSIFSIMLHLNSVVSINISTFQLYAGSCRAADAQKVSIAKQ